MNAKSAVHAPWVDKGKHASPIDKDQLLASISIAAVLADILPAGQVKKHEYHHLCPFHDDQRLGNASTNIDTGFGKCLSCGKGWDLFSLTQQVVNSVSSFDEALTYLNTRYGSGTTLDHRRTEQRSSAKEDGLVPVLPIPDDAPTPPLAQYHLGRPTRQWIYRDLDGRHLGYVCRFDRPRKRKEFMPLTLWRDQHGTMAWHWKHWPEPRPLYGLERLAQTDQQGVEPQTVVIVEGEKTADAVRDLLDDQAYCVMTWPGGSNAVSKADFRPLANRHCCIIPDNDAAGFKAALTVVKTLAGMAASLHTIPPPVDKASGWDLADAKAEGWTGEQALAYLNGPRLTAEEFARWLQGATTNSDPSPDQTANHDQPSPSDSGDGEEPISQDAPTIPADSERPAFRVFDAWLEHGGSKFMPGVWHFGTDKDGNPIQTWVCSPLHVRAVTFDGQDNNFGRLLRFKNTLGRWREWAMPMELLRGGGDDLRGELLAMGVEIDPTVRARNLLATYLQSRPPRRRMRCALQVGWCGDSFVLPDPVIGPHASDVIFQNGERGHDEHTTCGTLSGWQTEIAARAAGNKLLVLALSAAFVGPMLALTHSEGGGLHLVGDSSTGKTTVIEAACSVWGGPNYRRSWRATANGMEGAAALFNDSLLALDEISECDPREVGVIVYSLGNGRGKQRASRTGQARTISRWRCSILSSGERTIATTMQEGGHRVKAGQTVRLLDIPAVRAFGA